MRSLISRLLGEGPSSWSGLRELQPLCCALCLRKKQGVCAKWPWNLGRLIIMGNMPSVCVCVCVCVRAFPSFRALMEHVVVGLVLKDWCGWHAEASGGTMTIFGQFRSFIFGRVWSRLFCLVLLFLLISLIYLSGSASGGPSGPARTSLLA